MCVISHLFLFVCLFPISNSFDNFRASLLTVSHAEKSLYPQARAEECGPGLVQLRGSGAEEMGCVRTDRWQSHLFTVSSLAWGAGRGKEGESERGVGSRGDGGCRIQGSLGNRKTPEFMMVKNIHSSPAPRDQLPNIDTPFCLSVFQPDCVKQKILELGHPSMSSYFCVLHFFQRKMCIMIIYFSQATKRSLLSHAGQFLQACAQHGNPVKCRLMGKGWLWLQGGIGILSLSQLCVRSLEK